MEPSRGRCKNEMEIVSRQGGEADGGRGAEDTKAYRHALGHK